MCAASLQQPTFLHNSLQYEQKDIARIFEHMVLLSCFKTSLSVFYCRPEVNSAQELSFLMSAVELLLCHIIQYNIISFLLLQIHHLQWKTKKKNANETKSSCKEQWKNMIRALRSYSTSNQTIIAVDSDWRLHQRCIKRAESCYFVVSACTNT